MMFSFGPSPVSATGPRFGYRPPFLTQDDFQRVYVLKVNHPQNWSVTVHYPI